MPTMLLQREILAFWHDFAIFKLSYGFLQINFGFVPELFEKPELYLSYSTLPSHLKVLWENPKRHWDFFSHFFNYLEWNPSEPAIMKRFNLSKSSDTYSFSLLCWCFISLCDTECSNQLAEFDLYRRDWCRKILNTSAFFLSFFSSMRLHFTLTKEAIKMISALMKVHHIDH